MVLPYTEDRSMMEHFAALCDGFLFTGGDDIAPSRYGESTKDTCGVIQQFRDRFELEMLEVVMRHAKPVLAICRGIQLVNVAFGGTLYQDIPSEKPSAVTHRQEDFGSSPIHTVSLLPDTPIAALVGQARIGVNSLHHQAIKRLGDGLEIMALAEDGTVEALYLPGERYLRAYQWHPERMFDTDANSRLIFADFINACRTASA
jgi:putative glutamine amidotransferase